jgi:cytoskeletal protein CcmA (bactofilin family)
MIRLAGSIRLIKEMAATPDAARQADRVVLYGRRGRGKRKMVDHADDLGLPQRPARPLERATLPPNAVDLSGPDADQRVSPRRTTDPVIGSRNKGVDARSLLVGREVLLSGEITACDRLLIDGSFEGNLSNCQDMIIGESGVFKGFGSTENADVRGRLDGALVVHKRLLIRASGHVSGRLTYGEIEIECGGRISGEIRTSFEFRTDSARRLRVGRRGSGQ